MKFARVNGERQETQPGLSGRCPVCGDPMIARCGEERAKHWAHRSRHCDPWWENETEWHRAWKDQFPPSWQEVVHRAENGERHVADVKTARGWVIEFQHSYLKPEERRTRNAFYQKLIWVVNGMRLKTDIVGFHKAWMAAKPLRPDVPIRRIFSDESALLRKWAGSDVPIFFDFGDKLPLFWLFAKSLDGPAYVAPYSRTELIETHRGGVTQTATAFDEFVGDLGKLIADYEAQLRAQASNQPPHGFQRYLARRVRRRF